MTDTTPVEIIASWCGGLNSSQRDKDWIAGQAIEALTAAGYVIVPKESTQAMEDAGGSTRAEVAEAVGFDDPYDHGQCNRAEDPA